jgi:hypothetical protein
MVKAKTQDGETLLMDKSKIPTKYIEVPAKVVDKALARPKEKKPLSEKQQANLQRLIELNKKRREEKLASARVNVDELGEIPEDKVVVRVVKGKGVGRPRKQKQTQSESENEVVDEEPYGCLAMPPPLKLKREPKKVARRPLSETEESEEEEEEEKAPPMKKRTTAPKKGKVVAPQARDSSLKKGSSARKPRTYFSETSETSGVDADSDSDSEDEEVVARKVKKYVDKTKARMEALRQIEQQLKPQNKYQGMSVF